MDIFGNTISTLEKSLDYASAKNRAIANNISNADTPNYKAKDVVMFKDVLHNSMGALEMNKTHQKHLSIAQNESSFQTITKNNTTYNHNGNNVDIDKEMTELAKNQIYYNSLVERINGKFGSLQTVIRGGN